MAISVLSTANLDLSAASGSTSVTVSSGTTLAVLVWNGYSMAGLNVSSLTLNSVARTNVAAASHTGDADTYGNGVEYWISPTSGSQTLAWTWTNTPLSGEGPCAQIIFFDGTETSTPIRAGNFDNTGSTTGGTTATINVTSNSTDYVLGFVASWHNTIDCAGTGQTNLTAVFTANSRSGRCGSETSPGASSTTFNAPTADDADISAISIKVAAGGGGATSNTLGSGTLQRLINPAYYNMKRANSGLYLPARLAA